MEPPEGAAVGERLRVDGFDCSQPDEQLNPKKKVFEAVSARCWAGAAGQPQGSWCSSEPQAPGPCRSMAHAWLPTPTSPHPQVSPDLATNEGCVACYRGSPLLTSAGPATVRSIAGGSIK